MGRAILHWFFQLLLVVDQALNALLFFLPGKVWADETLSARLHRTRQHLVSDLLRHVVNAIFFWQENHCLESYESELLRRHVAPEYRD